jgi:hypothetical protein
MKIFAKLRKALIPLQHREITTDLPAEDRVTELYQAWQQGGKEGLRKAYQKEDEKQLPKDRNS